MLLEKKVSIITGGARGIGKAIAMLFAEEGSNIVIADIDIDNAKKTSMEIEKNTKSKSLAIKVDVSNKSDVEEMVRRTLEKFGHISVLVNNAGIYCNPMPFLEFSEELWDKTIDVNLKGVFLCSQAVAKVMVKQSSGKIINISSQQAIYGVKENAAYAASKAAVLRFTQVLAIELASYGIQVNSICPGITKTDMIEQSCSKFASKEGLTVNDYIKRLSDNIPLGRMATPEDIAGLVAYLASKESDYITGSAILITGGLTCN